MYPNYYELEKLMETRVKEALEEARLDALANEIHRSQSGNPNRLFVLLGNLLINAGRHLAGSQAAGCYPAAVPGHNNH